jgi:hypothetical protein
MTLNGRARSGPINDLVTKSADRRICGSEAGGRRLRAGSSRSINQADQIVAMTTRSRMPAGSRVPRGIVDQSLAS